MRDTESVKDPGYKRVVIRMPPPPTPEPYKPPLAEYMRENARIAADKIMEAFCWSESPEGDEFWNSVHDRLRQISETGDHRE